MAVSILRRAWGLPTFVWGPGITLVLILFASLAPASWLPGISVELLLLAVVCAAAYGSGRAGAVISALLGLGFLWVQRLPAGYDRTYSISDLDFISAYGATALGSAVLLDYLRRRRHSAPGSPAEWTADGEGRRLDLVTGLPQRGLVQELAEVEMRRWQREGAPFTVLLIDFGGASTPHLDPVLQRRVAITMTGALRPADIPGCYGERNFIVILPRTPAAGGAVAAERLLRHLQVIATNETGQRISLGVATVISGDRRVQSVFGRAFTALQAAKTAGGSRVVTSRMARNLLGPDVISLQ